jgi:hypothetical protein
MTDISTPCLQTTSVRSSPLDRPGSYDGRPTDYGRARVDITPIRRHCPRCPTRRTLLIPLIRVVLPRLEWYALEALARESERFVGEKRIARTVLDLDIPQQEIEIEVCLNILNNGTGMLAVQFIVAMAKDRGWRFGPEET